MPSTSTHGFRAPLGGEPANGPGDIGNLRDDVETYATSNDAALAPALAAWTSYTPAWTGSGTPTVNNGTLTGSYRQVGKSVEYRITLVIGSTTTVGSGTWSFSVPATMTAATEDAIGSGLAFDTSANARTVLLARASTSTTITLLSVAAGANVTNAAPYTWATGDRVSVTGFYQAA